MAVRVRFAPSPTGHLHLGGARTALYNYLFARRNKGTFILRIEDTDEVRSTPESVGGILESLVWLGLDWDEGPVYEGRLPDTETGWKSKGPFPPYFQMQRQNLYQRLAETLLAEDNAFWCFCSPELLEEMRRQAALQKIPPKYDGRCRQIARDEAESRRKAAEPCVLRFKMPADGRTEWTDLVHGRIGFENKLLDDFVLVKSSGIPTYNFACVADDYKMEITHALRGDDHVSNTPRQLQLYRALGWRAPELGHFSIILGPDGTRLSKRHGATSVIDYKESGYLPEALRNYLALLGWATPDSQDIFDWQELIGKFDVARCQKHPATFDPQKLLWMNGVYMRKLTPGQLIERARPFLDKSGFDGDADGERLERVVALEHDKFKLLSEVPALVEFFFKSVQFDDVSVEKVLKREGAKNALRGLLPVLEAAPFDEKVLEDRIRGYCAERGLKTSEVFHPIRVAVSGRTTGPTLFAMLEALGKPEVMKRIRYAADNLAV